MLDLNELEKKVDEMIASDTPEEMLGWLLKKRMQEYSDIIPEGEVEPLENDKHVTFSNPITSNGIKTKEAFIASPQDYSLAA